MAELTPPTRDLIRRAGELADELGHPFAGSEHLLLAIAQATDDAAAHRILREAGALEPVLRRLEDAFGPLEG